MKRKLLAMGLACMTLVLPVSVNVYARENVGSEVVVENAEAECWDGTSTEMPTKTVLIDGKYYYQISNAAQLAYIAQNNSDWCDNNYILTNDIVLNNDELRLYMVEEFDKYTGEYYHNVWTSIKEMNGHFDGAGYTISGLFVPNGTGLFEQANKITNLTVSNAVVKGNTPAGIADSAVNMDNCKFSGYVYGTDFYNSNVAGVVSYATGEITNCECDGEITSEGEIAAGIVANGTSDCVVKNCTNRAQVTAYNCAAGIMAKGHYYVDCVNEGTVLANNDFAGGIAVTNFNDVTGCINKGNVTATGKFAGGICAEAKGTVSNCVSGMKEDDNTYGYFYEYPVVTADSIAGGITGTACALITDCVNWCEVESATSIAGGIAGNVDYNYYGTIKNCINRGHVSTEEYGGGILGYAEVYAANDSTVIDNCYNLAGVFARMDYGGGIAGYVKNYNINQCYSVGSVFSNFKCGFIAGYSTHLSGSSTVSGCYYLWNSNMYKEIYAFGNSEDDVVGVAEEKPEGFFPVLVDENADPSYVYLGGADLLFFVNRMYEVALNRESEPAGRLNWFVALKNGTLDGAAIAGEFVLGNEFKLRGLNDSEYVDALYQTIFDREADITGKNHWLSLMAAGYSREYVLAQLVNLDEFTLLCDRYGISRGVMLDNGMAVNPGIPQFVSRLYNQVLGRAPESAGLNNNVMALVVKAETAESVAKNFFGSQEYALKNTDNATYVKDLYAVFMGREADEGGLSFWVSCMVEQGVSREWVLSEFAKSEEFKIIAASYGL